MPPDSAGETVVVVPLVVAMCLSVWARAGPVCARGDRSPTQGGYHQGVCYWASRAGVAELLATVLAAQEGTLAFSMR